MKKNISKKVAGIIFAGCAALYIGGPTAFAFSPNVLPTFQPPSQTVPRPAAQNPGVAIRPPAAAYPGPGFVKKAHVCEPEDLVQACICKMLEHPDPGSIRQPRNFWLRTEHNIWFDEINKTKLNKTEPLENLNDRTAMERGISLVEPEVLKFLDDDDFKIIVD